jgi:hypothetical protein
MNPVTSIDPAVFSARVNPQRQAEQAGPNRVDRKPDMPHDFVNAKARERPSVGREHWRFWRGGGLEK